jgi:hypothetical protein
MISRTLALPALLVSLLAAGTCACGNYSNEDVDFQLALPEQSDIQIKMQAATLRLDSAEYYRATRTAVLTFNGLVGTLAGLIDAVRGYAPTSRHGDQRIWGPFPADKYPSTWEVRVVMTRTVLSETSLRMDYAVDVRPKGLGDDAWVPFLTGDYISSGSARKGQGNIHLLASRARDAGYPVDDDPGLKELSQLDVSYSNADFPVLVTLTITNLPTASAQSGTYAYQEQADGAGSMQFDWQGTTEGGVAVTARMRAEWVGSGAGRADLILAPTGLNLTLGTDCWGADTAATYSYRAQGSTTTGDPSQCLF